MIDQSFCDFLEYHVSEALSASTDDSLNRIWCDGILLPASPVSYSQQEVNGKRKIILQAFSGESGQEKYELALHFGKKALSRYARGLEIRSCLPTGELSGWLKIDVERKSIDIQLL